MTDTRTVYSATDGSPHIVREPDVAGIVELCREMQRRPPRVTWLELDFADGVYRFDLPRAQIAQLEQACGYQGRDGGTVPLGIGAIFSRIAKGRAFIPTGEPDWANISEAEILASEITERDCIETIRLALIGGNRALVDGVSKPVGPDRAKQLINTYVIGQPLEDAWHYAFAILGARIFGVSAPGVAAEPEAEAPPAEAA